jgi:hypothetical protein
MRSITSLVDQIRFKTEKSIHLQNTLRKDNLQLKLAVTELKRKVEELETQKAKLEERNKVLQLAKKISAEDHNKLALKLTINELVREIDKCIAQLNR